MKGKKVEASAVVALVAILVVMLSTAAPASAAPTVLCEVSTSTCPALNTYHTGTTFKALGGVSIGGISCELRLDFKTTAISGAPLPTEITVFKFSHCSPSGVTMAPVSLLPWSFPIEITGTGPNGTGEITRVGSTHPVEVEAVESGITCHWELPNLKPTISGGGWLNASTTAVLRAGSPCALTPVFEFEVNALPSFYVTN